MTKKIISVVTAVAMLAALPMAYAADNGSGTEADPYIVSTAEEWTAATKKGYIKLNGDITITTAKTGGEMTLDLNGHTLEVTGSAFEVANNFTLTDSASAKGKLLNSNSASGTYALKFAAKNVTANVENAVVASTNGQAVMVNAVNTTVNIKDSVLNGGAYAFNLGNNGIVTLENVTTNDSDAYKGIAINASGGVLTIKSGVYNYHGTANGIAISGTSDVTIEDGYFMNPNVKRGAIHTTKTFNTTLKIKGGVFENTSSGVGYSIWDGNDAENYTSPKIEITGGEFKDVFAKVKTTSVTEIAAMGGTFWFDPTSYVDTENYSVTDNGNGTYTVAANSSEPTATPTVEPTEEPTPTPTVEPTATPTVEPTVAPTPEVSAVEDVDADNIIEGSDGFGKVFKFGVKTTFGSFKLGDVKVSYEGKTASSVNDIDTVITSGEVVFGIIVKSLDKAIIENIDTNNFIVTVNSDE